MYNALLIDDNYPDILPFLEQHEDAKDFSFQSAASVEQGLELLEKYARTIDVVVLDLKFPDGQKSGLHGLTEIKKQYPSLPVIVLTSMDNTHSAIKVVVACMREGASNYIGKSTLDPRHLLFNMRNASEKARLNKRPMVDKLLRREDAEITIPVLEQLKGETTFLSVGFALAGIQYATDSSAQNKLFSEAQEWTQKLVQALSVFYNNKIRARIRYVKESENANKLKVWLGFRIWTNENQDNSSLLRFLLSDLQQLMYENRQSPYSFEPLQEAEVQLLWSFDDELYHIKCIQKYPLFVDNGVMWPDSDPTDFEDLEILPPIPEGPKRDRLGELLQAMVNTGGRNELSITLFPRALHPAELDLVTEAEVSLIPSYGEAEKYQMAEAPVLRQYYSRILKNVENGSFVNIVISLSSPLQSNIFCTYVAECFFGSRDKLITVPVKGSAIDQFSVSLDEKKGNLAFYYTRAEAFFLFRLPLPLSKPVAYLPFFSKQQNTLPDNLPKEGILLGVKKLVQGEKSIYIPENDLKRHLYIMGQTGTGKSTLLKTMIRDAVEKGMGCCVIDPHGDLFEDVLREIPENRKKDLIFFDTGNLPMSARMNVLECDYDNPEEVSTTIQELINAIGSVYNLKVQGGYMFEMYLKAAILLVMDKNVRDSGVIPNMLAVQRVIQEKATRDRLLGITKSGIVHRAFENVDDMTGEYSWDNFIPWINSKLSVFTDNHYTNYLFNAINEQSLDLSKVMNEGKILLVRFEKGHIGTNNLGLVGSVFLSKLILAIMKRTKLPKDERKPFYVFIDEFQNFMYGDVGSALAEVRKYNVSMVVANQSLGQLPQWMTEAVLGNVGSQLFFRPGVMDYERIKYYLEPEFKREELLKLPNFQCVGRLMINNMPSDPFLFQTKI
jgi:DNA-binding response OmpR family regulator